MWRIVFWVAAMGVIATYAFFLALGAFNVSDAIWLSVLVLILAVMWIVHGVIASRQAKDGRDPRLVHARERRGF
jgi:hypothetical protein